MDFYANPELPFGAINVLVLTDVHSWVGGHSRQEPLMDADFGTILSFYERLKAHCDQNDMDLWFVSNGDWAHGTGLGNDASALLPILEKMPWDAVNCGNHELYENEKVEAMIRPGGFVDWFGDRYLTANILKSNDPNKPPLGYQYKVLEGRFSSLLTFGFLYNLEDACDLIEITPVEEVVEAKWFRETLEFEFYDAILILAHMDMVDPLVEVIRKAIRDVVGEGIPIQFITGHTHYRGSTRLDDLSSSFEGGRYLDTLGFVSFPTRYEAEDPTVPRDDLFQSIFLDTNVGSLGETLGMFEFATTNGDALSEFIRKTQQKKGLMEEVGCAPMEFTREAPLYAGQSLYGLYKNEVIPKMFFSQEDTEDTTSVMFVATESFRYDIHARSPLVVDDIWAVAPFNDTVVGLGLVSGEIILKLNETINGNLTEQWFGKIPNYVLIGDIPDEQKSFKFYTHDFGSDKIANLLKEIDPSIVIEPTITPYSSTLLWLSFVIENWTCDGSTGRLPDWFPTPEKVTKQLGREDDETAEKVVTVVLIIMLILVICVVLSCLRMWIRYIIGGHQPILQEELEAFKDEDASLEATDESPREGSDDELIEEDHEIL